MSAWCCFTITAKVIYNLLQGLHRKILLNHPRRKQFQQKIYVFILPCIWCSFLPVGGQYTSGEECTSHKSLETREHHPHTALSTLSRLMRSHRNPPSSSSSSSSFSLSSNQTSIRIIHTGDEGCNQDGRSHPAGGDKRR